MHACTARVTMVLSTAYSVPTPAIMLLQLWLVKNAHKATETRITVILSAEHARLAGSQHKIIHSMQARSQQGKKGGSVLMRAELAQIFAAHAHF